MEKHLFAYTDFREFLRDYYESHKQKNPKFSYRLFAKKAGFSSSAFLPLLISGKRTIGKDSVRRLAEAMGLSKREGTYFETLVWLDQAKDEASKNYYRQLLTSVRKDKSGKLLRDEQFEYLSHWHYPILREFVALPGFREDPEWIRRQLGDRISAKDAREALDRMVALGLLERDDRGRLRQVDASLVTEDEVLHTAVFMIHRQMLVLAREILLSTKGIGSEISGLTMAVSRRQFKEIVGMIREFQNNIIAYLEGHEDVPVSVAQFNVQFFHVLNEGKGGIIP